MFQSPEGFRMQDTVTVALKIRSVDAFFFGTFSAATAVGKRGSFGQKSMLGLFISFSEGHERSPPQKQFQQQYTINLRRFPLFF